jgi:cytochrome c553
MREMPSMHIARSAALFCVLSGSGHGALAQKTAADRIPDTMEARVQACTGCHGAQGRGVEDVYFPRLAGKPAGYLYNQLLAFRDGRRKYVPMNYLLAYLPDAYLKKMAEHFAGLDPPPLVQPAIARAPQLLADGRRIVTGAVPGKKIPACVTCHGAELGGREPGIPGLLGLRADYVSAQLGAWRFGIRTALAPDCMQFVASSLSDQEVAAVAAYLASLPVGTHRPLDQPGLRLPLACGSQPEK